jgi:Tautomerase enzyme
MPLLRFDLIEGRSESEVKSLLDAAHQAMLAAFNVPPRDRYQIVEEHPRSHMIIEDTGLGMERTEKLVVVQVITRGRKKKQKEAFYRLLCEALQRAGPLMSSSRWSKTAMRIGLSALATPSS